MTTEFADPKRMEARTAPHAQRMTDSQFDETWDMAGILRRGIQKSGKFAEKLDHQSIAFALGQKISKEQAELVLRDQYEARYGETMRQTLDGLHDRETILREAGGDQALYYAGTVETLISDGDTMPFYKAFDAAAVDMARQHGITETGAKSMMKDAFQKARNRDLYETGKALEEQHHKPVREAENTARRAKNPRARQANRQMGPAR
ncbi:MAG: hypothetical protein QNJ16_13100 [Rhodobacter sp.]|nr:hypothetical protein [Rhodobacter sp.]